MPSVRSTSPLILKNILIASKFILEEDDQDNWCLYRDLDEVMITLPKHGANVSLDILNDILAKSLITDQVYLDFLQTYPQETAVNPPQ